MKPGALGRAEPLPLGRVAVIGAGKMGTTLIRALTAGGALDAARVVATARHRDTLDRVRDELGVAVTLDNRGAAEGADLVLLCIKPQQAAAVLAELSEVVTAGQLVVTILAGVPIAFVEDTTIEWLRNPQITREEFIDLAVGALPAVVVVAGAPAEAVPEVHSPVPK